MSARRLLAIPLMLAPFAAAAQSMPVKAELAWSRATPPGASTGAAYLTLTSPVDDTLTGVSSPAAAKVEIHEMTMAGDVMRMREVEGGLKLPAAHPVTLRPNGYHLMMLGLHAPLKQGQSVTLHLSFAHAPAIDVTAPIGALGSTSPPAMP